MIDYALGAILYNRQGVKMIKLDGEHISLELDIKPMACPRPRISGRYAYMPSTYTKWKRTAKAIIRRQCQIRDITEPVFIEMSFVFQRPKTMMRKKDSVSGS